MAPQPKAIIDYIDGVPSWWESSLQDYQQKPATAFLREAVHITDAIRQCRRLFKRRNNKTLNKDGQDSIYRLGAAAMSSMMSHFETFQRSLFAGMLEASRFVGGFQLDQCCKRLQSDSQLNLDAARLLAYRGHAAPIGQLVADGLGSWHNPRRVNQHFTALAHDVQFYSGREAEQLDLLWQLRHSVVHTAGWLTHADAQKIPGLVALADRPILLNENFVEATARRLHVIVARSTSAMGVKFIAKVTSATSADRAGIEALFEVGSPRATWLRNAG
jgi:hypothetical protein